jgi:oxygen-dependent protoporphyrinogen oxidase
MQRIVVIGGGITGLAAAHRLLERSSKFRQEFEVTVLEAGHRVGGTIQTEERDGFLLERGADSFISEKPEALELVRRLGIETHLIQTNKAFRRSLIVRQGRLLAVPEGFNLLAPAKFWPFITSGVFSLRGKARIALDLLLPRGNANGDESLAQFVRRRLGREALERMAQPMVGGIYNADPETLSLRATMPRFLEMERRHGSLIRALRWGGTVREVSAGARYSLFLSFDRGMQVLTDELAKRILDFESLITGDPRPKASIQTNTKVESLTLERKTGASKLPKWKIKTSNNEILIADAVCLALPAYISAALLHDIDAQLASELEGIPYASSATINLAFKRENIPHLLDGFGFVVPFIEKRTIMACTFSSVKFAGRAPEDHALLRAFVGGALQPELFALTESELISRVRDDLRDLLGIESPPLFTRVSKWERSMPQYLLGHIERVKRIESRAASLPGLSLAGNAYSGPGIPDCIRGGEFAADNLLEAIAANAP